MTENTIEIGLTRDQVKAVQEHFFPYMTLLCETAIKNNEQDPHTNLLHIIVDSLLDEIKEIFGRKFPGNTFVVALTETQAIAFYYLILHLPPNTHFPYLDTLCKFIKETIEGQVWK